MKLPLYRKAALLFIGCAATALSLSFGVNQAAQTTTQLPERTGHVSDFAHVIDDNTRQQVENILANLKQKTGIQFDIATVETTGGQDIFDYSQQLAQSWHVLGRAATGKNLLLVLSVNEKTSFTQFSKAAQREMPEGVLGEITQRLRGYLDTGRSSEGISAAVEYFVNTIAQKQGFNVEDLNGPVATASATPAPEIPAAATPAPATPAPIETKPDDAPSPQVSPAVVAAPSPQASPKIVAISKPRDSSVFTRETRPRPSASSANNADESEEVELTLTKPVAERIAILKKFLDEHPDSTAKARALELLVSAHAAVGDELLKKSDSAGGVEHLLLAISEAPLDSSEKLFAGVISQIPLNLYLRGERAAADTAARNIVAKFGADPKRLLSVAGFYIAVERGEEAQQVAMQATKQFPDIAEAHQTLGMALHVSLRLDEAAAEYKRALELDPKAKVARRKLADLRRAFGKDEEALALYREQLTEDARDKAARAGVVLSLLDLGRTDEAGTEMEAALQADPKNLPLLSSAAYWFAAHNQYDRAMDLANKAIEIEPRFTWSHIAMSRALIAQRNPLAAERVIRFARLYGKFPTLDYELANAMVSAGLYDEAAEVLTQTFRFNNNQIEARLGGRIAARATNFIELLAPERQASLFQLTAADSESSARVLKGLLVFATSINAPAESINEHAIIAAAKEFASGADAARAHREIYAASRLLQKGIGYQAAYELAESARTNADAALTVPALTIAVQADEYREIRARALASGGTPEITEAPANILSNILRGHIEDISGWALFNSDKADEAVDHLNRAVNILPTGTPALRTSLWHLGAALERQGKKDEAISYYIKSYNAGEPDPLRRSVIEKLYRQVNGSLEGLEQRIGDTGPALVSETTPTRDETIAKPAATQETPVTNTPAAVSEPTPSPSPATEVTVTPAPSATPAPELIATPSPTPELKEEPQPLPLPSPTPEAAPAPSPSAVETSPSAAPSPEAKPAETPAATPATFNITGSVKDASNKALEKVVIVLISSQGTVLTTTTDEQGNYSFTVAPAEHGFRIIPSRDGFTFAPLDKQLTTVSGDMKELNFIGTPNLQP